MIDMKNSEILGGILRSVYIVASRRTTESFAATVLGAIIKTLEQNYEFLKYVHIENLEVVKKDDMINISPEIDLVVRSNVGKAIEAIIRIVYMDLVGKTGLFFMKELKDQAGERIIAELKNYGVDFSLLQTEQQYLHRQHRRRKHQAPAGAKDDAAKHRDDVSLLGYTWKNVGSWKYDPLQKTCVLYSREGKELDRLNLDTIIESYVTSLTNEEEELPDEYKEEINLTEKELDLLRMLFSRDMDAETATVLLHISKREFEIMVQRLVHYELLHYVSFNEIELTEEGINYITSKNNEKIKMSPS